MLRPATLLKRRLWHRCFFVNYVNFLRTSFLQNISGRLLLPFPISPFDISYVILISKRLPMSLWNKENISWSKRPIEEKMSNNRFEGFIKQPVIKQSPTFLSFSFFLFSYKSVCWTFDKIWSASLHCIEKWKKFKKS